MARGLLLVKGVHSSGSSNSLQRLVYDVSTWQQLQAWNLQFDGWDTLPFLLTTRILANWRLIQCYCPL